MALDIKRESRQPVLVIGRGGQVAQALQSASDDKIAFLCLGREDGVDITKQASLRTAIARHNPWLVVNAAGYTAFDRAESEPAAAFAANADGVGVLAQLCAERECPLIHLSTDYVFDGTKQAPYSEDDPVAPLSVYGASKLAGEDKVRSNLNRHIILRISWVYSASGTNFVKTMLRLAETKEEIAVVADQQGSPTAANDIASAIRTIAYSIRFRGISKFSTFHLAAQGTTTWFEFAKAIFDRKAVCGGRAPRVIAIPSTAFPAAAKRPHNSRLDCSKIKAAYGIALPFWRESLDRVLAELLRRGTAA